MQSASVNNQLETEQVSEKVAPPAYAAQSQSAKSFPESSEEKYCSEPCRGRRHNSSKNGKCCYIAVIVVLVLIILGMVGSIVGLTCFAVICGSESTPEDKSDAANYQLYVIDEVSANGKTASKSDKLTKTALSDSTQKSGSIFVLPIYGTIVSGDWTGSSQSGYVTSEDVTYALKYIAGQENVKALILDINSPGGSVTASDNIYHEIMQFKKENNIPVIAMFEGTACSGGYYSAMAADYIMALPTTWTGSIGVIMEVPEISKLMGKVGVNVNTITSLNANGGASFKDIGSTYRQMRPEERQLLQTLVTQSWNRFTDIVAQGRKGKITKDQVKKLADGRIYSSEQALKHKLIDQIGYRQDLYKKARTMAKAPQAPIICVASKTSFWDDLGSVSSNLHNLAQLGRAPWKAALGSGTQSTSLPQSNCQPMYILPSELTERQ